MRALVALLLLVAGAAALQPRNVSLSVKSGTLGDFIDVKLAEWRVDFDEDIYFSYNAPCPAGTCPGEPLAEPTSESECAASLVPCDFTLTGSECGRARFAVCEAYCAAQRPQFCQPLQTWTTLRIGEESAVFDMTDSSNYEFFRINWDQPCRGMRIELFPLFGATALFASPDIVNSDELSACVYTSVPEFGVNLCPMQTYCYRYTTFFFKVKTYTPYARYTVKITAFDIEPGPRRLEPLPDAPATFYGPMEEALPHIKLNFSVPLTLPLPPGQAAYPFMLSTSLCGPLTVQAAFNYRQNFDDLAVFVSTYYDQFATFPPPVDVMFPSSVLNGYTFFLQPSNKIYVCPPPGVPYGYVFFIVTRLRDLTTPATFTFAVDYDRPGLIEPFPPVRIGDFSPSYTSHSRFPLPSGWYLQGSGLFQLRCPDANGQSTVVLSCRSGCNKFECCVSSWPSYPTKPSLENFVLIPSTFAHTFTLPTDASFQYPTEKLGSRSFGVVVLLEAIQPGSPLLGPLGADWPDLVGQCTISAGLSSLTTLDGRWMSGSYTVPVTQPPCVYEDFLAVKEELASVAQRFTDPTPSDSVFDPTSIRYRADILLFSDAWQSCTRYVNEKLLLPGPVALTSLPTVACPVDDASDPCCNPQLSGQCCAPRTLALTGDLQSVVVEESTLQCTRPECSSRTLNGFVSEAILSEVGLCTPDPSQQPLYRFAATSSVFEGCLQQVYGGFRTGVACLVDSDCPALAGSRCDVLSQRCLGNTSELNAGFTDCLQANLLLDVALGVAELNDWDLGEQSLAARLLEKFSSSDCVQYEYGIQGSEYRSHYELYSNFPGCPIPTNDYLVSSASTPGWAVSRNFNGALCAWFYPLVQVAMDAQQCGAIESRCNWDATVTDREACESPASVAFGDGEAFCGVCESTTSCRALAGVNSAAECAAVGSVCVLNDGTVVTGLSEQACATTYSCNVGCAGGAACQSAEQCEQQGSCTDTELIYPLLEATTWATEHSRTGFCTFPQSPLNSPDCSALYLGSNPSSFGCVVFGRCTLVSGFQLNCVVDYDDESSCTAAMPGARWWPRPSDRASCEVPVGCDDPTFFGPYLSSTYDITLFRTPKNATECALCNGQLAAVNQWTAGRWLGGSVRPTAWVQRALVSPFGYASTLDFRGMLAFLKRASDYSISFSGLNTVQCFSVASSRSVARILCDCLAGESAASCFDAPVQEQVGVGRVCPSDEGLVVAAPPFSLSRFDVPDEALRCAVFNISATSREVFNPVPVQSVTISFRGKDKQLVTGSYESVRNDNNAVVGQVIGDVLTLTFARRRDAALLRSFELCIAAERGRDYLTDAYPVFDFGVPDFDARTLRPLHVAGVTFDNATGTVCGVVTLREAHSYAPIIRLQRDTAKQGNAFTAGQRACLYAVAAVYTLVGGVLLVCFVRVLASRADPSTPSNLLWLLFGVVVAMRAVYLYLVPSGVLNQPDHDQLLDYWFMDFPISLYLCANLLIGVIFAFVRLGKSRDDDPQLWLLVGVGSFLIVMLFISTLLAFRYQVLDQPALSGPLLCPVVYDSAATARVIRLVYQSIVLFVALCIGLLEIFFGYSLYHGSGADGAHRVLFLAVVTGYGVISDSVAFLVYYIVNDPTAYFAIVLVFTEALPIAAIAIRISTRSSSPTLQQSTAASGSHMRSRSTSGRASL